MSEDNPINLDQSVTMWIDGLKEGNEQSAQQLWERYFSQLVQMAGNKLPRSVRRDFDEEDVAVSAFHALCQGAREGHFPKLHDRGNLWSILVVITARKAIDRVRSAVTQKRGGGDVRGESVFLGPSAAGQGQEGIHQVIGREPTAEFAAEVAEQCQHLLAMLPDEQMQKLARLKLEGFTNQEAAKELGCGYRTIERRLGLIRRIWDERT